MRIHRVLAAACLALTLATVPANAAQPAQAPTLPTSQPTATYQRAEIGTVVAPWSSQRSQRYVTVILRAPSTAQILRNGVVVKQATGPGTLKAAVPIKDAGARWQVRLTEGGVTSLTNIKVARHWSPLLFPTPYHFPRCSLVTWDYSTAGQPAYASDLTTDITAALARISKVTGVTFRRVARGGELHFTWKNMGAKGAAATGGAEVSVTSGVVHYIGTVDLNTQSEWLKHPGFGRVDAWGGVPARGILLMHEIGHSMGLGHVRDTTQVMNPLTTYRSPTEYGSGDRAGFTWLYAPSTCR